MAGHCLLLAVFADGGHDKAGLFSAGFDDYISYPFIAPEIWHRLAAGLPGEAPAGRGVAEAGPPSLDPPRLPVGSTAVRYHALVDAACTALLEDLARPVSLDGLARELGTNRNTLAIAFRQTAGCTVFEWLRERRLIRAGELLRLTGLPIQAVGFEVGYADAGNFATAFRRHFGLTPRQYRSKMRPEQ